MKKALLATAMTFGMFTAAGSLARADDATPPPPPPPHHGMCHHHGSMLPLDDIKLTSSQKKKIDAIREASRPTTKPDMTQERALHQQIRALLTAPGTVDTAQISTLQQQLSTLHTQRETERMQRELQKEVQIHDVLTKKQLKQIAEHKDEGPTCPPPPPPPGQDGAPPPPPAPPAQ
ncbi:MAG: Spy/CpxP family protein refolding chaperone [Acetobacter sp.]|uniref:Spy/CpxP family protein refolding chaperone n=1 Tax=Acetobacter sp. TaxID=440 RepID=UPI003F917A90